MIIPAYNEGSRLGHVLEVVTAIADAHVIVVDDGSRDGTAAVAQGYEATLVSLPVNGGKGAALAKGVEATKQDILCFLDADLYGLDESHVRRLVDTLTDDPKLAMVVGDFSEGRRATNFSQNITPILNGQRALRRDFFEGLPNVARARFGVEVLMSTWAKRTGAGVSHIALPGLAQHVKEEKFAFPVAIVKRLVMYRQCFGGWWQAVRSPRPARNRSAGARSQAPGGPMART